MTRHLVFALIGPILLLMSPAPNSGSGGGCLTPKWNNMFHRETPTHSTERITASTVDSLGNVYVTGWSTGNFDRASDIVTIKYDRYGAEQWRHNYYPALPYSDSESWGIAVDSYGDVYVAGHVTGAYGVDCVLIKYPHNYMGGQDPEKVGGWVRTYNGSGNGDDQAWDIALDPSGYIYVTGYSTEKDPVLGGLNGDYITIKYDGEGNELAHASYDGTGHAGDSAFAVAVDPVTHKVSVTGRSTGIEGNWDIVTVMYDDQLEEEWVQRYNGSGNGVDGGTSLALDSSGNVYVTGFSMGTSSGLDYATIAYDGALGTTLWTARYDGPGSANDQPAPPIGGSNPSVFGSYLSSNQGILVLTELVASVPTTVVYVTGQSTGVDGFDFATVKYRASDGSPLWYLPGQPGTTSEKPGTPAHVALRYNGPANGIDRAWALASDSDGHIYVAGPSFGLFTGADWAVVKYEPDGTPSWSLANQPGSPPGPPSIAARYDGPAHSTDQACGFATWNDPATGTPTLWRDPATNQDRVSVTGGSRGSGGTTDFSTVVYDGEGTPLWVQLYDWYGPSALFEAGNDIALSTTNSSVCVTGYSGGYAAYDVLTLCYGSSGELRWQRVYDGSARQSDQGKRLAMDSAGNVYVAGSVTNRHGGSADADYLTVKYDGQTGAQLSVAEYDGPVLASDGAVDIAIDSHDDVYVTGSSVGVGTNSDYLTIRYDSALQRQWTARFDGAASAIDSATAIAVGSSGVYVTGLSWDAVHGYDIATVAYDKTDGTALWTAIYNGLGDSTDAPSDIALDSAGNVYVTGLSVGTGGSEDYVTIKFDGVTGQQLWVARYDGLAGLGDSAFALVIDPVGNVYVTGVSAGMASAGDAVTIKYDGTGNPKWVARYNGSGNGDDRGLDVAVDSAANVYVTGRSFGTGNIDYVTLRYDGESGELLASATYNGTGDYSDESVAMALDLIGNVYVTGRSSGFLQADDIVTIKYDAAPDAKSMFLIQRIRSFDLPNEISRSLEAKIETALALMNGKDAKERQPPINILNAFINECHALTRRPLTSEQANELIAIAQDIIDTVNTSCAGGAGAAAGPLDAIPLSRLMRSSTP